MPTSRSRRLLFSGAAAVGLAAGAAGLAAAATGGQATPTQAPAKAGADAQDPSYTSSVTAPEVPDGKGSDTASSDTNEAAALKSLATISPDQARAAALAAAPGTVAKVELGNEHGNVVYDVEITKADGTVADVTIDAGNGKVLAQEAGDKNESRGPEADNGKETPDATEPAGAPGA